MSEQHVLIPVVFAHFAFFLFSFFANVLLIYTFLHSLMFCGSCVKRSTKRKRNWSLFQDRGWKSSLARSTHPSEFSHFPFSQEALCQCGNPGIELLQDTSLKNNWGFFFCNLVPPQDFHSRLSCHSWCPTCIPLLWYIVSISTRFCSPLCVPGT